MKLWLLIALLALPGEAQDASPSPAAPVDFVRDIQPLLKDHCLACHGEKKQKGQLRLDSKPLALKGRLGGKSILPGDRKSTRLNSSH